MQLLEKKFEQERKLLELKGFELEKRHEGVTQELTIAKSTLAARHSDLAALQNNLKELEELREMKEVKLIVLNHLSVKFGLFFCMHCNTCRHT